MMPAPELVFLAVLTVDRRLGIGELYAIERHGEGLMVAEREALRQAGAQPKLAALHAWSMQTRQMIADGSGAAKAIDYARRRWEALVRYAESGRLPICNNA